MCIVVSSNKVGKEKKVLKKSKRYTVRKYAAGAVMWVLMVMMAVGDLSGCRKGSMGDTEGGVSAKGRYMEEDMELPTAESEGILELSLGKSEEGNLVVFSSDIEAGANRYEYKEGQWEQVPLEWIRQLYEGKEIYPNQVRETEDGTQVVLGISEEGPMHVARGGNGQAGEELNIPYLNQQTEYGYPMIMDLQIDRAGNYWMYDMYQQKIVVVSPDSGEVVEEIQTAEMYSNSQSAMFRSVDGSIAVNTDQDIFTIYDENYQEKGTMKVKQQEELQMCGDGENWYAVSEEGITRIKPGNDIQEVVMDGSLGAMGSSGNTPAGIVKGENDDFYVLYTQMKSMSGSLAHYVYDAEASTVPEHTLRVFGVAENDTVREAVVGFQKQHPDVKVEFQTVGSENVTMDDVRTLNTELLSGNGADVLLLDGLPVEAYMEKGILEDLTGIAGELTEQDAYLETILKNTVQKDGSIYGMPVKFSIPVIYGSTEVQEALGSLGSLSAYLEGHPEASVFGLADKEYIRDFLFQLYQEEILGEDGKIDQEKMALLLETETKIAANTKSQMFEEYTSMEVGTGMLRMFQQGMFSHPVSAAVLNYPESVITEKISGVPNMIIPYAIMRQAGLMPNTLQGFYISQGIAGINKNAKQPELAEEFVKYLFSEEVQSTQLDDGLPVMKSALENLQNETSSRLANTMSAGASWNFEGEEGLEVEAGYPTVEEVQTLVGMCGTLEKPAMQNSIIWSIYQEEAGQYLIGSVDAQTAAKNIAQKVDTYLAE